MIFLRRLRDLNWTFSLCGIRLMTKMAVRVHVDNALPSLCRFPSFEISTSIEDMEQAAEYTRGHFCYSEPISPAFQDVMGLADWYLWVEEGRCKVWLE